MVLSSMKPDVVIPEIPFSDYILKEMRSRKDRLALIHLPTGKQYTFGDLEDKMVRCASALFKLGIQKGDVVAVCAPNCAEILILMISVAACAGVVTTCNPSYTADEIKRQFQHAEPSMVFCVPENVRTIQEVAGVVKSIKHIFCIGDKSRAASFESLLKNENGSSFPRVEIDPNEDLVFLLYSSGTTGPPKGVMLTHRNVVALSVIRKNYHSFPSDCDYSCLPLFHVAGIVTGISKLISGSRMILDNRFDLKTLLSCIEKYKVTRIRAVPPMLLAMDKSPLLQQYNLSSLRDILCGAAPLAPHLATSLSKKLGCSISQAWGMTEVVPITRSTPGVTRAESVGSVCANTKVKVIDIVTGEELGPHLDGELCVKGPQVMKGYYKNVEATRATIDVDGWMHSGDIGHYDEDEMIYIVDRLKELIKYKGFQVAPAEIESILIAHPKVADVAVIGIPDEEAGELPKAFIVKKDPSLTQKEVHDEIQGKLSKYKYLRGGIEFTSSIPKTASGKILRRALRQRMAKAKM